MKITRIERLKIKKDAQRADPWLIGFTDLTTLLLAFFILLFATATPREQPWVEASKSMRTSFGGEKESTYVGGESGESETDRTWLSDDRNPGLDLSYLRSVLRKQIDQDASLAQAVLWQEGDAVIVAFPEALVFSPGQDRLSEEGEKIIRKMAAVLMKLPNALEVIGYADPTLVNSDGRFGSNWHLSLARAYAVAESLHAAGYRSPIQALGRGVDTGDTLPKNLPGSVTSGQTRRVDLRLTVQQN